MNRGHLVRSRTIPIFVGFSIACLLTRALTSCTEDTGGSPAPTGQGTGDDRKWRSWGTGGQLFYAVVMEDNGGRSLVWWAWEKDTIVKKGDFRISVEEHGLVTVPISQERVIYSKLGGNLFLGNLRGQVLREWDREENWYWAEAWPSRNARYVGAVLDKDSAFGLSDLEVRQRVAVLNIGKDALTVVGELPPCRAVHMAQFRRVIPSDDGSFVALTDWDNGVAVIDTKLRKVLWKTRPQTEISSLYVAISPENDKIYVGGREGRLYCMDIRTGRILSSWWASEDGKKKSEGPYEIGEVAVSPDGEYVAAATAPFGPVYMWSTRTGRLLKTYGWGGVLCMSFSPDSKYLGMMEPGRIDVTEVPQVEKAAVTPASQEGQ